MVHPFILNKGYHEWPERFISESDLKKVGKLKADDILYLKVQGGAEQVTADNPVDLGRDVIEQIYSHHPEKYQFIVNSKLFFSPETFITGAEIRAVGKIPPDEKVFLKLEGADTEVLKDQKIDLRPFPIEEFYSKGTQQVSIKINKEFYKVKPGKYSVAELKKIGSVEAKYTLSQIINGDIVALSDDAFVDICGGEIFISNPKEGSSS